ncbi:unnamed protein product [Paramecium pentaurelia]|uniref:Leucine rich repeat protein n=1 Tax=Paramecium pentaurelia TaxID=43138 RepID=A0A8S1W7I2_9CILI|nr:unnamed protein product [Paramecium pentaurelia]
MQNNQFSNVFWRKVREDMRMEILLEKKPLKQFKLYELTEDEMNINLDQVTQWSPDNEKIYKNISENGFADFICNKEYMIETYTNIVFDSEDITLMDNQLLQFKNLQLLRLNHNKIEIVQHLPQQLIELHLFNNPITALNLLKHNLQYLGLGYCLLNDDAIQTISKFLPQLIGLDLAHNQLCDLEYSVEACKKISNLKMLSLYGNPLVLMPQYFIYIVDNLLNLRNFDEQSFLEIKNRLEQAEKEKQAKKQEALRKQQEEFEIQQKLLADKNKKGGKPGKQPDPVVVQQPQVIIPIEEPKINLNELRQFKISLKIQTLENLEGILLDKYTYPLMEQNSKLFQSKYVITTNLFGVELKTKEILYETATIENEIGRIDFEFSFDQLYNPEVEIRDAVEQGFLVQVQVEEPKMYIADDGEKKPVLGQDELPEQQIRILGVCKITCDWLRGYNKQLNKKYRLFKEETKTSAEHWFPLQNEQELVQSKMEMIQKEKDAELEEKKAQQALIDQKKEQSKGKGKDVKKKDDKKNVKKGKDEPVQKVVGQLDWEVDGRQYIFVNEKKIHRATEMLLAIGLDLGY